MTAAQFLRQNRLLIFLRAVFWFLVRALSRENSLMFWKPRYHKAFMHTRFMQSAKCS